MLLDLGLFFRSSDLEKPIDVTLDLSEYELPGNMPFDKPATVKGSIQSKGSVVSLEARVDTSLALICDRCLEPFDLKLSFDVHHLFTKEDKAGSNDVIVVKDNRLDVDELIFSDISLQLPTKLLCGENCKGLCCQCGADLNEKQCDCDSEE